MSMDLILDKHQNMGEFLDWVNSDQSLRDWWSRIPSKDNSSWVNLRKSWRPTKKSLHPTSQDFYFVKPAAQQDYTNIDDLQYDSSGDKSCPSNFWPTVWNKADVVFKEYYLILNNSKQIPRWVFAIDGKGYIYRKDKPKIFYHKIKNKWFDIEITDCISKGILDFGRQAKEDPIVFLKGRI